MVGDPVTETDPFTNVVGTYVYMTLSGPDWDVTNYPAARTLVVSLGQSVIGVYTTLMQVDQNPDSFLISRE